MPTMGSPHWFRHCLGLCRPPRAGRARRSSPHLRRRPVRTCRRLLRGYIQHLTAPRYEALKREASGTALPNSDPRAALNPDDDPLPSRSRHERPASAGCGMSSCFAVARRAHIVFEGKADRISGKLASDRVSAGVPRSSQARPSSSREAPVRVQHRVLDRHARSRQRDHTGQLTLPIGQANEPIATAAGALDCSPLYGPNSVGELGGGCGSRRFYSSPGGDCCDRRAYCDEEEAQW